MSPMKNSAGSSPLLSWMTNSGPKSQNRLEKTPLTEVEINWRGGGGWGGGAGQGEQ